MKNDINDILNGMFRSGRLSVGKSVPTTPTPSSAPPELVLEGMECPKKVEQAMENMAQVNQDLSQSLQKSIEQLTQEAKADMEALDLQLSQDGVRKEDAPAGNKGNSQDLDAAFEKARAEVKAAVLGQEEMVDALLITFKRPFVAGFSGDQPMARAALLGEKGSGRHSALTELTASLARQGVLKSPKVLSVDLSRYGDPASEKLFVQDVFSALKSGASVLVLERYEKCHPAVLGMVGELFRTGVLPLPGRYAEQKGMLVDIGTALVPGVVSTLSAAGKYLFLLTEQPEGKIADVFGGPFLTALEDVLHSKEFSRESLLAIAKGTLEALCQRAEKQLQFTLTFSSAEEEALVGKYSREAGCEAITRYGNALYRALSEEKLRKGLPSFTGVIVVNAGELEVKGSQKEEPLVISCPAGVGVSAVAVEEVKEALDEIVGLGTVKDYILSLEDHFKMQQLRREKGMKAESSSMHMIFTGNPGTGKTTVARIVSRYLKAIGLLSGGQLVEVTRADLVGQYVGHTAPLTQKAIQSALGGVLFVDEAYALFRGKDDSFGLECIDTLVKGMEDHRDDLIVILAGYSREMEEFLTANSGLRSRFPNIIEFPDYTPQELLDIAKSIVKGKGYRLDPQCDSPLLTFFQQQQEEGDPRTNGNGRMARNKVEEAILASSRRTLREKEENRDLELLLPVDFGFEEEQVEQEGDTNKEVGKEESGEQHDGGSEKV